MKSQLQKPIRLVSSPGRAELLDVGIPVKTLLDGALTLLTWRAEFLNARAKMCHLFFCSSQLFKGSRLFSGKLPSP